MSGIERFSFSRFGDTRKITNDTEGYDEYVEGVEPDETTSLETPIKEDNVGFRLIQKMGWTSGTGLGKFEQGRVDPVPFEQKDDHMGLGRWALELEQAQDATEKRKVLENEREMTADRVEKYKQQAEKEQQRIEQLTEMHKSFYCELCDRQYTKYSEWDNHINSYSHHHNQRLRDLKQYETGRKFGGHRSAEEEREKMRSAQLVALERAQMAAKRRTKGGGFAPAFKPISQQNSSSVTGFGEWTTIGASYSSMATPTPVQPQGGVKRSKESEESQAKIAAKKARLAKFGLKFQSAGTLVTIGEQLGRDSSIYRTPAVIQRLGGGSEEKNSDGEKKMESSPSQSSGSERTLINESTKNSEGSGTSSEKKLSFGFQKKTLPKFQQGGKISGMDSGGMLPKGVYTSTWEKPGTSREKSEPKPAEERKGPPPKLMSRQRELTLERAFGAESDDEDDSLATLDQLTVRSQPKKFRFNIRK